MSAITTAPVSQNVALNAAGMLQKLQQKQISKEEYVAFLRLKTPDTMTVLNSVHLGVLTAEEAAEFIQGQKKPLYAKVGEKGGVSVYGLQRMPVTLYGEQWDRLIAFVPTLQAFMKTNQTKLSKKSDKA